jgi:hypothetical protein
VKPRSARSRAEGRVGRARGAGLDDLVGPEQEQVLLDVRGPLAGRRGQAPRERDREWRELGPDLHDDEQRADHELRVRSLGQEHLRAGGLRQGGDEEAGDQDRAARVAHG